MPIPNRIPAMSCLHAEFESSPGIVHQMVPIYEASVSYLTDMIRPSYNFSKHRISSEVAQSSKKLDSTCDKVHMIQTTNRHNDISHF